MISDVNLILRAADVANADWTASCVGCQDERYLVFEVSPSPLPAAPPRRRHLDFLLLVRCLVVRWLVPLVRLFFPPRPRRHYADVATSARSRHHDFDFVWSRDAW